MRDLLFNLFEGVNVVIRIRDMEWFILFWDKCVSLLFTFLPYTTVSLWEHGLNNPVKDDKKKVQMQLE